MKATKASIDTFLSTHKVAIAGVSRDPKKFGYIVFRELREKGYEVFPVNPGADKIDGVPCFKSVSALPLSVHNLLVVTPRDKTREVVAEAISKGIDNIWIQQKSETPEVIGMIRSHKINLVVKECILMYLDPVTGVHKFHRNLRKFFGLMPK